jgi:hypothetical protein
MKYFIIGICCFLQSFTLLSQMSGTYTIGGFSPNFTSINQAVSSLLTNGVNGPVTLNLRAGTYYEQVQITEIPGASNTNKVIFQSEAQDSAVVDWKFNGNNGNNYVLFLNGADFITLRHLSIYRDSTQASGGRIICLQNGASNNRLEHSFIRGKYWAGNSAHELIYSTNTLDTNNYFGHNTFKGGWHQFYLSGTSASVVERGTVIEYNKMSVSQYGIEYSYHGQTTIRNNSIQSVQKGIRLYYGLFNANVLMNSILVQTTDVGLDLNFQASTTGDSLKVIGNMVTSASGTGIYILGCPFTYIYHNSVYSATSVSSSGSCLYLGSSNVRMANNIFRNNIGYCLLFSSAASVLLVSDYNIYSTGGLTPIRVGSTNYTLTTYQNSTLNEDHSYQTAPNYTSSSNLHILSDFQANAHAFPIGVFTDIDGDIRALTPDIGADEFDHPDQDAGVISVVGVPLRICPGSQSVAVNIRNYGEQNLTAITVNWSVNNVVQAPYLWYGNLNSGDTAFSVPLGNYNFQLNGNYTIKSWTNAPNGLLDPFALNDTTSLGIVKTRMSGMYTVGGITPDFSTWNTTITEMADRGICGPITYNVRPGTYVEFLSFANVNGASLVNTITYQSEQLDSTSVTIGFPSSGSSNNWVMQGSASHYRFKYFTIKRMYSTFPSYYNLIIFNNSTDLIFDHVSFITAHYGIGDAVTLDGNGSVEITNCIFHRLSSGITKGSSALGEKVKIKNNVFRNLSTKNILASNTLDSLIISNNLIYNDTIAFPANVSSTGISIVYTNGKALVESNIIHGRMGGAAISLSCLNGTPTERVLVRNNFVTVGPSHSTTCAIYVNYSHNVDIFHNNLRTYNRPWVTSYENRVPSAVSISGTFLQNGLRFTDNCIYADSMSQVFSVPTGWGNFFVDFDYNNIYRRTPASTPISLSPTWPGIWNANSIEVNPMYTGLTDLHVNNPQLAHATWRGITTDMDGDLREWPTIGADEGRFYHNNARSVETSIEHFCDSTVVYARIINFGVDTLFNCHLSFAVNGITNASVPWIDTLKTLDTTSWIVIGSFDQNFGQSYTIETFTSLPNGVVDLEPELDTSSVQSLMEEYLVDLGTNIGLCFPASTTIATVNPAMFSDFLWNTNEISSSIQTDTAGVYTLYATNIWGCIHVDSISVEVGGLNAPIVSENVDSLFTELSGDHQWYVNGISILNATDSLLIITSEGEYYTTYTDTLGCVTISDSVQIGNLRDIGSVITSITETCDSTFVYARIKNHGLTEITALSIETLVNGSSFNITTWAGSILSGDTTATILVGRFDHQNGVNYEIVTRAFLPNLADDFHDSNDSSSISYNWVEDLPNLGPDIIICWGDSINLFTANANLFNGFIWSTGETTVDITVETASQYIIECYNGVGCLNSDTIYVEVGGTINPIITQVGSVLYSSMSAGNQWYLNGVEINGETNPTIVPIVSGDYSVGYTDGFGCITYSNMLYVDMQANRIDESNTLLFDIYPNPTYDEVKIVISEAALVELFDLRGAIVFSENLPYGISKLSLGYLQSGVYQLRVLSNNSALMLRLIIE